MCLQVGQLFLLFLPPHEVDHLTLPLSLPHSPSNLERPPTFPHSVVFHLLLFTDHWKQKQKLVFRSFSPTSPGFQDSRSPLGNLLPWFPHCRTLCPRDSSWPPHCPTEIQLSSNLPQTSSYSTLIGLPWTGLERMVVLGRSRKGKVVWIAWLTSHSKVTLCSQIIVCINFEFRLNYNLDALVSFYNWNWLFIKVIMDHFAFITHSCSLFLLHYCFSWFLHS